MTKPPSSHAESGSLAALARIVPRIDEYLEGLVRSAEVGPELRSAIGYSLLGGGKRMRPALAWLCCEAVGADGEASLPAGAAVEMVHAFSLVHDDLPAMDDDDLRRGKPTLHVHAGEAMAILAGDALLSMAFETLAGGGRSSGVAGGLAAALCRELAAGTRGMIDGQVLDTLGSTMLAEFEPAVAVEQIHLRKTGALIVASARMGAMSGLSALGRGIEGPELEALDAYGRAVGLMFQAVDDLLDVEATAEDLGKRTGKDAEAGKRTYPEVLGVEGTRALVDELTRRAVSAVEALGEPARPLADAARWLGTRKH